MIKIVSVLIKKWVRTIRNNDKTTNIIITKIPMWILNRNGFNCVLKICSEVLSPIKSGSLFHSVRAAY